MFYLIAIIILGYVGFRFVKKKPKTIDQLRGENLHMIYKGQNREYGSLEYNNKVQQELVSKGVDLNNPINIVHSANSIEKFNSAVTDDMIKKLEIKGLVKIENPKDDTELLFVEKTNVKSIVFNQHTNGLNDFLFEYGFQYTGWKPAE